MIEAIDAIEATNNNQVNGNSALDYPLPLPHIAIGGSSDAVVFSEVAQAKLLAQQGLSTTEIADELGITAGMVLAELGIPIISS